MKKANPLFTLLFLTLLGSCYDHASDIQDPSAPSFGLTNSSSRAELTRQLFYQVNGPWRLIKDEARYQDGTITKNFTYNYLTDPEFKNYKQYWIFHPLAKAKVQIKYSGTWADKNWDNYEEVFDVILANDFSNLAVIYSYDGGAKNYTELYEVTRISATQITITCDKPSEAYFRQLTFNLEDILQEAQVVKSEDCSWVFDFGNNIRYAANDLPASYQSDNLKINTRYEVTNENCMGNPNIRIFEISTKQ
jgi:hypothetical protein